ncbi:hypothetical protein [Anaeromyxobacter terrae]|uniref:hypothetical protein n=1 Tax=Anaeromyxobacter terrae TaxID=2925406 RepID=UPI001F583F40|nr:hypothetical protein [Anaeromyxobacter sp. SG22]
MSAPAKKRQPFAHAADLPAAYAEFSAALAGIVKLRENGPAPVIAKDVRNVPNLSAHALWRTADAQIAAWERVGAAARRVHVAMYGKGAAARWDGFRRTRRSAL